MSSRVYIQGLSIYISLETCISIASMLLVHICMCTWQTAKCFLYGSYEPGREKIGFFAYTKTKAQISFAVTAKLISAFVFAIQIVQSLYCLYPKFQASGCTAQFVSDVVGNPEDRFSHNEALMIHQYFYSLGDKSFIR